MKQKQPDIIKLTALGIVSLCDLAKTLLWQTILWAHILIPVLWFYHPPMNQTSKECWIFQSQLQEQIILKEEAGQVPTSWVHGPLTSSGLRTFCHRCRHCTSDRSGKNSAAYTMKSNYGTTFHFENKWQQVLFTVNSKH